MKCPYCGKDLEQGLIQSPHALYWRKVESFTGKAEPCVDSIVLSKLSILKGSNVTAYLCRSCEKIVIDCSDSVCDANRT